MFTQSLNKSRVTTPTSRVDKISGTTTAVSERRPCSCDLSPTGRSRKKTRYENRSLTDELYTSSDKIVVIGNGLAEVNAADVASVHFPCVGSTADNSDLHTLACSLLLTSWRIICLA